LFNRDSIVLFENFKENKDNTFLFENFNSTNWNSVRFKPPPGLESDIPWRVEFRTLEV
jgi:glutamate--cysteine ligase catalytic subunit